MAQGRSRGNGALTRELIALGKKVAGVTALLNKITDASKLQQESLQVNKTLSEVIGTNSKVFETTIGGFNVALKNQSSLLKEGFTKVNVGTLELAGALNVTNQSVQNLVRMNTKLLSQGQLSEKQIGKLNTSILDSSLRYGIAASKIVDAISALDTSYTGLLGVTAESTELLNQAMAKFGTQVGPQISKIISTLTTPGDISKEIRTGLLPIANKLLAGTATLPEFSKALQILAKEAKSTAIGGKVSVNVAESLYNQLGILASQVVNNNSLLTVRNKVENKLLNTLNSLWKKAIVPLEVIAQKILNVLIPSIKWVINSTTALVVLSSLIGAFLLPAVGALIGSLGILTGGLSIIGAAIGAISGGFLFVGLESINKEVASMGSDLKEMNARGDRKDQDERFKDIGGSSRFALLSSETLRDAIDRIIFQNNNDIKELVRVAKNQLGLTAEQLLESKKASSTGATPIISIGR